jgi:HEPN domain-containing protein
MLPDRRPPDDPREWLNRARSNLVRARTRLPGVYLEDLCFDAQQAAEKAIKAVLIARDIAFPYIHDLARLLTLLEQGGEVIPPPVREAARLTRFAVASRYPGVAEPVTAAEYEDAVATAATVVAWAEARTAEEGWSPTMSPGPGSS